ncbi:MAG: hypothetical protein ACKVWR_20835 [Acidimicrobiales bacterium]
MIHDGAGQYTRSFDDVFTAIDAEAVTTPPGAPQANALAERWVRSVRHELLDRTIIWNERQLRRLLQEYVALQRAPAAPLTQATSTRRRRGRCDWFGRTDPATRHLRRTHQRVPHRSVTTATTSKLRNLDATRPPANPLTAACTPRRTGRPSRRISGTLRLYWFVHDAIKAARGETARLRWTQAFAAMIESYVEDALRATAPRTFEPNGSTFYTEESLETAYGQVARCDVAIDFGDCFLLLEIVSGQLTVKARVHNDISNLDRDLEKLVFGKCEQLHNAACCILQDEEPLTGVKGGVRNVRIIPALVIGGGLPLNFVTYNYIRRVLEGADLLQDPRIGPLAILDLDDVDQLEGISEQGVSPTSLLEAWQRSDHNGLPLHNYLFASYPGTQRRPARMKASVEAAMADIRRRHGMP